MIKQAQALTSRTQFPNVSYQEASAESLPSLQDSSVDMIVAAQADHWSDYSRLFPEMKRVVRREGTLAFWAYKDHVFVDSPRATDVLNHYAYGENRELLGPYWSRPGCSSVHSKLRGIVPPSDDWKDVQRVQYEPSTKGPRLGSGTIFLSRRIKLGDCMDYIRTWSSFHAWQEAHPAAKGRQQGGTGDVIDKMFDAMRSVEPAWQVDGWEEKEVEMGWGAGLLLARKRSENRATLNGGAHLQKDASGENHPSGPRIRVVDALEDLQNLRLYEQQQEYRDIELIRMLNQHERVLKYRANEEREQDPPNS
ncbi:MAG: hypothetical protein Q9208_002355 [Pyrenodesmia sp. 3 TL-2023]